MRDEHRLTIINEIKYWKQSKLLPEHYCDFLLALYTEGEGVEELNKKIGTNRGFPKRYLERFQIILLFLLLPFSFVVIYFTELQVHLQLIIISLFLSYSIWVGYNFREESRFYLHFSFIVSLFLLLSFTLLLVQITAQEAMFTVIGILFNFLIWILLGLYYKFYYLIIAGVFGIGFTFIYYFI